MDIGGRLSGRRGGDGRWGVRGGARVMRGLLTTAMLHSRQDHDQPSPPIAAARTVLSCWANN